MDIQIVAILKYWNPCITRENVRNSTCDPSEKSD